MLDGQENLQIAYAPKLTILSFFMPILVLLLAFVVVTASVKAAWWRVLLSGFLSGGAICAMHYIADLSISNYTTSYHVSYVIGSALIAVFASSTALALFFIFEASWSNAWWKRAGCAMVLAGAVSGMHWCAALGTRYMLIESAKADKGQASLSRNDATIIVACLAIAACAIITASAVTSSWVSRLSANKAQKVILASAVFDYRGRIMVSYEGHLPSQVVTKAFIPKTNTEIFDTAHPTFHSMFRLSRCWATVAGLLDSIHAHAEQQSQDKIQLVADDGTVHSNYDAIICEMFCLAADRLASLMNHSILDVGRLWDEIWATGTDSGTHGSASRPKTPRSATSSLYDPDADSVLESGQHRVDHGRGSVMFLIRHVRSHEEVDKLKAVGYRFAELHQVVGNIRANMQIVAPDLLGRLRRMAEYDPELDCELKPGVHVSAFVIRARLSGNNGGGFDVLVQKQARNKLPSKQITQQSLQAWHQAYLTQLSGLTVAEIIQRFSSPVDSKLQSEGSRFSEQIVNALREMRDGFEGNEPRDKSSSSPFDDAVLLSQVIQAPCTQQATDGKHGEAVQKKSTCSLICFRLVLPVHTRDSFRDYQFDPLQFFKTRQLSLPGSKDQAEFAHQIHRDIMTSVHQLSNDQQKSTPNRLFKQVHDLVRRQGPAEDVIPMQALDHSSREVLTHLSGDEKSSDVAIRKESVSSSVTADDSSFGRTNAKQLGGIMVSQQVVVGVEERKAPEAFANSTSPRQGHPSTQFENSYTATAFTSKGANSGTNISALDNYIFVDELLKLSIDSYTSNH